MLTWDSVRTLDKHVMSRHHFERGTDVDLTATGISSNVYGYKPQLHIIRTSRHHRYPLIP
jgi:hypothetical protein